jgi:UDP-N-acetylmuramate--alanine ligase
MRAGIEQFSGVERRFEMIGEVDGITIIDDYAHHPTEIEATLQAARAAYPSNRVIAAFQPHLYTRTRDFHREFASALSKADVVYLCDLYPAREQPIPGVSAKLIADSMTQIGSPPHWEGPRSALAEHLARELKEGDVVITIGAGDITKTGEELNRILSAGAA